MKKLIALLLALVCVISMAACGAKSNSDEEKEEEEQTEKKELTRSLAETHPDAEVYFVEGGQEIYPYIFVVE